MKVYQIYAVALLLLLFFHSVAMRSMRVYVPPEHMASYFQERARLLEAHFSNPELARLASKYLVGDKRRLSPELQEAHRTIGTIHLFSPSGIHYSALLPLLLLVKLLSPARATLLYRLAHLTLSLLTLCLPGLYPLKRVAWFHLSLKSSALLGVPLGAWTAFFIACLIDLVFGSVRASPLSFVYSFLFWGTLLAVPKRPGILVILALFGAQYLVHIFDGRPLYLASIIACPILTSLFAFVFPVIAVGFVLPEGLHIHYPIMEWAIRIYAKLTLWGAECCTHSPAIISTIGNGMFLVLLTSPFLSGRRRLWASGIWAFIGL